MPVHFYSALDTRSYKTPEGFPLGTWHSNLSTSYKKGKLDKEKVSRLEEIGFIWNLSEEVFEQGYQETLKYKKQYGNANAPDGYKTPEGFSLGKWLWNQRTKYKKGKLDKEKVSRLEEIGFIWNLHEEAFEQGCQETLRYKKQSGDANAPIAYKTPEGFALGPWQSRQRDKFKQGILDKRNIKKLEEVGFLWKKRRAKMRNKDNLGLDKSK